jgi:uncharacterized membrane protein
MQRVSLFLMLVVISLFSVALIILRMLHSGQPYYVFLVWNLFLAWLPLLFAWLAVWWRRRPVPALAMGFLWLLFFPNAPYLVTDLIHLRAIDPVPLWFDLILLLDYAHLGLFLGFVSLREMHGLVSGAFGSLPGWLFVFLVLGLSGLGVYIGRFLRWNSWDLFTRPLTLINDIMANLTEPRTVVVSGLLALLMLFGYLIFTIAPASSAVREVSS